MCLQCVDKAFNPPIHNKKPIVAWKVFKKKGRNIVADCFPHEYKTSYVPSNKWLESTNTEIYSNYSGPYTSGFHCFTSRKQARDYASYWGSLFSNKHVVRKVLIKSVVASGIQAVPCSMEVIVAKKMKVIG